MKRLVLLAATAFICIGLQAQMTNCGIPLSSAGTLVEPASTSLMPGELTPAPVVTGYAAGLPNTEYVLTNPNDILIDSVLGPIGAAILDINATGIFDPSSYGLGAGDAVCVTMVTYDLQVIKDLVDRLLNGSFLFVSCCSWINTFVPDIDICATLNSVGIDGPEDINNLSDILDAGAALGGGAASLEVTLLAIEGINEANTGGLPCTTNEEVCYTTTNEVCYSIDALVCQNAPTGLTATNDPGGVLLSWNSLAADGVIGYRVQGRVAGSGSFVFLPTAILEPSSSTLVASSLLVPGADYEWQVIGGCDPAGVTTTPFSSIETFTAPLAKMADRDLTVTNLFPNPTNDMIHMNLDGLEEGNVELQVIDMSGRLLIAAQDTYYSGQQLSLDVSELNTGLYIIKVQAGQKSIIDRFEVSK